MSENIINVNLANFTKEEREKYLELTKKGCKPITKRRQPRSGETYWSIDTSGTVTNDTWTNHSIDKGKFEFHNCFNTKEQAEFELEKRKVICELEDYAAEHNETIDWNDNTQHKWSMYFSNRHKEICCAADQNCKYQGAIYFSSEEVCKNAVSHVGEERIKKYLFGVE